MNNHERIGVSQVQLLTNTQLNWIFRELSIQDFGVDAHIEIMGDEYATGKLIGVQIKCGESYFKESNGKTVTFRFDKKHCQYWLDYAIPVIVVLVNPVTMEVLWEEINKSNVMETGRETYKILVPCNKKFGATTKEALLNLTQVVDGEKEKHSSNVETNHFQMGINYEFGENGSVIDYEKARFHYGIAADRGDRIAQFNYSLLMIHGKGGEKDYARAYYYMKKAALQGFVPAFLPWEGLVQTGC